MNPDFQMKYSGDSLINRATCEGPPDIHSVGFFKLDMMANRLLSCGLKCFLCFRQQYFKT